ncbi:hypothetical protein TSMEX_007783 [Taenia solium]|eukprot:TsM_000327000 transcript=TsM_000327000 gene=TsM_000327000
MRDWYQSTIWFLIGAASMNTGKDRPGKSGYGRMIHCSDGCYNENVGLPGTIVGGNERSTRSELSEAAWSLRLLREVSSLPRKALQVADWAGERLAGMVGITDSKFDIYLWQREYETQKQTEEEANNFMIDPVLPRNDPVFSMEMKKGDVDGQMGT